jgi:hypothetical protein
VGSDLVCNPLCFLRVLCVSVVRFRQRIHHRDSEGTEISQRKLELAQNVFQLVRMTIKEISVGGKNDKLKHIGQLNNNRVGRSIVFVADDDAGA